MNGVDSVGRVGTDVIGMVEQGGVSFARRITEAAVAQ